MLATIHDDTWNVLNMPHVIPNSKWWDYSDIPGGGHKKSKALPTWSMVATTLQTLAFVTTVRWVAQGNKMSQLCDIGG